MTSYGAQSLVMPTVLAAVESGGVVLQPCSTKAPVPVAFLSARESIATFPENLVDQPVSCRIESF